MNDINIACLLSCARTGNISYTAEELGLTYQSVSRNLQKLEAELGCTLFVRDVHPLTLSDEARIFCEWLKEADARMQNARRDYREVRSGKRALRIGYVAWSGFPEEAQKAADTVSEEMGVSVELTCGSGLFLEEAMRQETIDAAIVPDFTHAPQFPPNMLYEVPIVSRVPYQICCSREFLDASGNIDYSRLSGLPLYYSGSADPLGIPFLPVIVEQFHRSGVLLPKTEQLPNFVSVISETAMGNCFTVCAPDLPEVIRSSRYLVQEEIPDSCIEMKCIWRQDSNDQALIKFVSEVVAK